MNQVRGLKIFALAMLVLAISMGSLAISTIRRFNRVTGLITADNTELQTLRTKYGPERHSQFAEEWVVRDFFNDERGGVFVDVGANDYKRFSNTYYLETKLGWSGLAIEPQTKFAADYVKYRPRTRFVPLLVSDVSDREAELYVPRSNDLVASGSAEFAKAWGSPTDTLVTKSITLDELLNRTGVSNVDFLSMDIELGEPAALAGFSIEKVRPRLVCVEAHPAVRQKTLNYFARHGYVLVGKYWRADGHNFWFAPIPSRD
jgi:FkbM family methyltransferase